MKNQIYIILIALSAFIAVVLAVRVYMPKDQTDSTVKKDENIFISQYEMKEDYGWHDIILWNESKESFEKAYNTKLNWMNYDMGFQRDPMCISPIGGDGEWQYDKICFNFVIRRYFPNMLDEIAEKSKGKTLVVIGSIHDNNRFWGNVYWCE